MVHCSGHHKVEIKVSSGAVFSSEPWACCQSPWECSLCNYRVISLFLAGWCLDPLSLPRSHFQFLFQCLAHNVDAHFLPGQEEAGRTLLLEFCLAF
jgi:hypothetical protein